MDRNKNLNQAIDSLRETLLEKRQFYGNAFNNAPDILTMLYPDGVPVASYSDLLTVVRIIDKLYRIANQESSKDPEDPWKDIAGYAILSLEKVLSKTINTD